MRRRPMYCGISNDHTSDSEAGSVRRCNTALASCQHPASARGCGYSSRVICSKLDERPGTSGTKSSKPVHDLHERDHKEAGPDRTETETTAWTAKRRAQGNCADTGLQVVDMTSAVAVMTSSITRTVIVELESKTSLVAPVADSSAC